MRNRSLWLFLGAIALLMAGCGKDTNVKWRNLYTAVQKGDAEDVRRHLNREGVDVNEVNETYSWTPLHRAVVNGDTEIVKLLLEHGAHTDKQDRFKKTPLDYAVEEGHEEIAALIRESASSHG
jgi:ankyrin repeat protein